MLRVSKSVAMVVTVLTGLTATLVVGCSAPAPPVAAPSTPAPSPSTGSASANPSPSSSARPATPTPKPSVPTSSPSTQEPSEDQLQLDVTIANGKVDPSGRKLDVALGTTVVLKVTSDIDDEIHAHLGDDDFSLFVDAGRSKSGKFVVEEPGRFEVESHELGKIIVILNVR